MSDEPGADVQRVALRITNSHDSSITFAPEPCRGRVFQFPAGATFEVVARGPEGDTLDVEASTDTITVWAWSGSTVAVFHAGQCITDTGDLRVPLLPVSMSTRGFLGMVTGDTETPPSSRANDWQRERPWPRD